MKQTLLVAAAIAVTLLSTTSCKDTKTYAELLNEEAMYINNYLADQRVTNTIPTDSTFVFQTGPDAPYYRMDEDGNVYMQVIKAGTKGNYAKTDQVIYFRFTRYNLADYKNGTLPTGEGNESDMTFGNSWFRFQNYTLESSYQWGSGVQAPLIYLPIDCEVNLVIKSQYGLYGETTYVQPFLYRVRYYPQLT